MSILRVLSSEVSAKHTSFGVHKKREMTHGQVVEIAG
jgi:hypothetical protein